MKICVYFSTSSVILFSCLSRTGEAEFADDIPMLPNELHGAFVQTSFANAKIDSVDASKALVS